MSLWQNARTFGITMAVRGDALVLGSWCIVVLHGKQESFSQDDKIKCNLQFKAAIPRISMLLACCWVCCIEKHLRRLVTAPGSPHRDGRYRYGLADIQTLLMWGSASKLEYCSA
jgi:hypothetical protein